MQRKSTFPDSGSLSAVESSAGKQTVGVSDSKLQVLMEQNGEADCSRNENKELGLFLGLGLKSGPIHLQLKRRAEALQIPALSPSESRDLAWRGRERDHKLKRLWRRGRKARMKGA